MWKRRTNTVYRRTRVPQASATSEEEIHANLIPAALEPDKSSIQSEEVNLAIRKEMDNPTSLNEPALLSSKSVTERRFPADMTSDIWKILQEMFVQ